MLVFSFFLIALYVSASPVPASSIDLSVDEDSLPVDTDNLADMGCTETSASIESPNEDIDSDLNIFRRESPQKQPNGFCPSGGFESPWTPSWHPKSNWRAPIEKYLPLLDKNDRSMGQGMSPEKCPKVAKQILLSCGGPEVWYHEILGFALNCVLGRFFLCRHFSRADFHECFRING